MKAVRTLAAWLLAALVAAGPSPAQDQTHTWSITVKPGDAVESDLAADRVGPRGATPSGGGYSGMLTLGVAWTSLVDPGFKLVSEGGQTVIGVDGDGDRDLLYVLSYTPFVWGKRDLGKSIPWHQRLNPTVGIALDDIQDNAFVGVSADLPAGIILTFGRHFRRITVLPESTGLSVGDPFTGTADQLPTAEEWEDENFVGLTLDLRAMAQLLRAAGTAGGGS